MITIRSLSRRQVVWEWGRSGTLARASKSNSRAPSRLLFAVRWRNLLWATMNDGTNAMMESEPKDSKPVSFNDAARFLGVDLFTFYSVVQREEIPTVLTA
jgi:hypothetical protein